MYSATIRPKVEKMFAELRTDVDRIVSEAKSANEAVNKIVLRVSSETASRGKRILSDMLFDLSDALLKTSFFADTSRQNRFIELNLRQEILNRYQLPESATVDYKEAVRIVQALKVGGGTLVIGGAGEIGVVLIRGLSLSRLVPIPVGVLVAVTIGVALVDYFAIEPSRSKKKLMKAVDQYLAEAQQQFLNWFDEAERDFNERVDQIKRTM